MMDPSGFVFPPDVYSYLVFSFGTIKLSEHNISSDGSSHDIFTNSARVELLLSLSLHSFYVCATTILANLFCISWNRKKRGLSTHRVTLTTRGPSQKEIRAHLFCSIPS